MTKAPSLFVSHGSPMMAVLDHPSSQFWAGLGQRFEKPKAILAVSAHWETEVPTVSIASRPETIHDFGGFPRKLYELQYPAPGAPELARKIQAIIKAAGGDCEITDRGLDHGTWVPLMRAYPKADVPILQLSLQSYLPAEWQMKLGEVLAPLRDEGVMIFASGAITHNLRAFFGGKLELDTPILPWVADFIGWMREKLDQGDREALVKWESLAPHAAENHPSPEHLLPLFFALGAGGKATRLHDSVTYGVLAMDAYAFT